jgi:intracellular sulfur oxidation DsrE/DsrF family protein
MNSMSTLTRAIALCATLLLPIAAHAADHPLIAKLLSADKPPPGVVFEIVTGDPQALRWAVPQVADYAKRLRERFPKLEIAVVTHGREMFALQKDQRAALPEMHAEIEQLVQQHIPVHVCETYAAWRGISAEAFPAYVNVAPAGPAQVKSYLDLGYTLIKISAPIDGKPAP